VTVWVAVPEFAVGVHVPLRVWVKPVPQPVAGAHAVYCQVAVPLEHALKPLCDQL
jgi:hypothetical protein